MKKPLLNEFGHEQRDENGEVILVEVEKRIPMDELCEVSSDLTSYIWQEVLERHPDDLEYIEKETGDVHYTEPAQDIFNSVMDIVDDCFNREVGEEK